MLEGVRGCQRVLEGARGHGGVLKGMRGCGRAWEGSGGCYSSRSFRHGHPSSRELGLARAADRAGPTIATTLHTLHVPRVSRVQTGLPLTADHISYSSRTLARVRWSSSCLSPPQSRQCFPVTVGRQRAPDGLCCTVRSPVSRSSLSGRRYIDTPSTGGQLGRNVRLASGFH